MGKIARQEGRFQPLAGPAGLGLCGPVQLPLVRGHQRGRVAALQDATQRQRKSVERLRALFPERPHGEPLAVPALLCHLPQGGLSAGPRRHLPVGRVAQAERALAGVDQRGDLRQAGGKPAAPFPRHPARSCPIGRRRRSTRRSSSCCFASCSFDLPRTRPCCPRHFGPGNHRTIRAGQKWGARSDAYGYVQQYFAWLDGRSENRFSIYPYDGALFDPDPLLDDPQLRIDDGRASRTFF